MRKLLILIFGIILFFAGCDEKKNSNIKEKRTIKIGAILPLTGPVSDFGKWIKKGIVLAEENINSKSENIQIKTIYEDSRFDAKTGIFAFKKLLKTNQMDICFTAMSKVAIPIINNKPKNITILLQDVTYPNITLLSDNIFRHFIQSNREADVISDFILDKNISRLSILYVNDEAGLGASKTLQKKLKKIIIKSIGFSPQSIDFKSTILQITKDNPDSIYLYGNGPSWANILKTLKELNYKGKIFTNTAMYIPLFRKIAGNAIEDVYFTFPKIGNNARFKKFVSEYKRKYKEKPQLESIYAYDLIMYIYESVMKFPKLTVSEALNRNKEFNSLFSELKIINNDFITPISIGQIKNNKIKELN